ncbi:MAG: DUF1648 domain-containing protein [Balneolales bacterium]|nr:DUF1648 domain-containing protein [Balneolales bacterium]
MKKNAALPGPGPKVTFTDRLSILLAILQFTLVILFFMQLPDQVPVRFDSSGNASATGSKYTLLLLPFTGALLYYLFNTMITNPEKMQQWIRLDPDNSGMKKGQLMNLMRNLNFIIQAMIVYIIWTTISVATGVQETMNTTMMFIFVIMILSTVSYLVYTSLKATKKQKA